MDKVILKQLSMMLLVCLLGAQFLYAAQADEVDVSRFSVEGLSGWESKTFKGKTLYRIVQQDGHSVLEAKADGTASGLIKEIKFSPFNYPYLKWRWKIAGIVTEGDARTKHGDDYAARIYVIFPGRFFWQTRALNYIWANQLPQGEFVPNAFTGNAMLLAAQSGPVRAGEWVMESRNILDDFRRVFGEDPPEAGGIAIMTDTDNTGSKATAWFGDIRISSRP